MALDHIDAGDDDALAIHHPHHLAAPAFVLAGDDDDFIVLSNSTHCRLPPASQHFRGQGNDFHESLAAQLAGDRPEDAGADRLQFCLLYTSRCV